MTSGCTTRVTDEMWPALVPHAEALFPRGNPHGVLGFGLGPKRRAGANLSYKTLVVYVERKLRAPGHPIPEVHFTFRGRECQVKPDIKAVGRFVGANLGQGCSFSGLHPGAAILVDKRFWGGLACLLGDEEPTHFLTAGHVFPAGARDVPVYASLEGTAPHIHVGTLEESLLERTLPGLDYQIDAALVRLTEEGRDLVRKTPEAGPSLEAICETLGTHDQQARAFLPTLGDYSRPVRTVLGRLRARMSAEDTGHEYTVGDMLQIGTRLTEPGDSGTILCTTGPRPLGLGLCIGGYRGLSLFEPLERTLSLLPAAPDLYRP